MVVVDCYFEGNNGNKLLKYYMNDSFYLETSVFLFLSATRQ